MGILRSGLGQLGFLPSSLAAGQQRTNDETSRNKVGGNNKNTVGFVQRDWVQSPAFDAEPPSTNCATPSLQHSSMSGYAYCRWGSRVGCGVGRVVPRQKGPSLVMTRRRCPLTFRRGDGFVEAGYLRGSFMCLASAAAAVDWASGLKWVL